MSKFNIDVVGYLDKDELVAEIYYDSVQWSEISYQQEALIIKFYPRPNGKYWEFSCVEAIETLEQAKTKLLMKSNREKHAAILSDPEQLNNQAEKMINEIINHPEKKVVRGRLARFGDVMDIYAPDMRGVRYSANGEFIGFLE